MSEQELWNKVLNKLYPMSCVAIKKGTYSSIVLVNKNFSGNVYLNQPDWQTLLNHESMWVEEACADWPELKNVLAPYTVVNW